MREILSAVTPVFFVAAAAFVVRKRLHLDVKTLSSLNIYMLIPALVFDGISRKPIEWALFGRIAAASVLVLVAMTLLLTVLARLLRIGGHERGAFLMTMFPNLGNFGLPVCLFAFGQEGLAFAIVVMVIGSFLQNSLGIYFAQRAHHGVGEALRRVFRFPMMYAFILALVFQKTGWRFPEAVERAISLTAGAAIPVQLIILGAQLAATRLETSVPVFVSSGVRLIGGPAAAAIFAILTGMEGVAAKAFIVQMGGPVAIGMAAYGVQFDVAPRFLASVVSWTFLLSLFTVSTVLYILDFLPL
ncbi:MAG TPA: AEC family transporter [Candidatus Hydrogenedentes bacterium]|nr:AEC family transporter [Candidatus Hydrogenedentota bacterium]HOV75101.1 AEC family transporter [Candidatus Hydrogenedentota bacterium]